MDAAHELARHILEKLEGNPRIMIGIAGEPGAGKSTLSAQVLDFLTESGVLAACVPMDGFHLANEVLVDLGRRDRKGAIDTFDAAGYVAMLRRVKAGTETVYAPCYDRAAGCGVAGAIDVRPECQVVLTEGNYLLDGDAPWREIPSLLDAIWFVRIDPGLRRERLIARHIATGKEPDFAEYWVDNVDETNARRIRGRAEAADRIVDLG